MENKQFELPEIEIISLEGNDIVTNSGGTLAKAGDYYFDDDWTNN